jgi:6-phosphogluconolactonase (cycloisomerase 2 family)
LTSRSRSLSCWPYLLVFALGPAASSLRAEGHDACADINNSSNNRLSVFKIVKGTGELQLVQEIPTGGHGSHGGYYSLPQIAATRPNADGKACVFAVNAATHDITAFRANVGPPGNAPCDCFHEVVGRVTVADDQVALGRLGGGVAVHPDGTKLYSANPGSNTISTFDIAPDCSLNRMEATQGAPERPADIQAVRLKSGSQCVAVSSPVTDRVSLYRAGPGGMLSHVDSQLVPGPGRSAGLEFSNRVVQDSLYVVKADPARIVIVRYHVKNDCTLETLPEPRITVVPAGRSANVAELDPEHRCLFVPSHQSSSVGLLAANHPPSTLTTFAVHPFSGDLQPVTTVDDSAFLPSGLGFADISGLAQRFLYYTSFSREVFRRPVTGCMPGPVTGMGVRTGVQGTGLLRALVVLQ